MPMQCPDCSPHMPDPWMFLHNAHPTLAPKGQQPYKVKYGTGRTQLASRAMPEMLQLWGICSVKKTGGKFPLKKKFIFLQEGHILFKAVQSALAVNLAAEWHSLSMDASVTVFAHSSSSFSLLTSVTPAFSGLSHSRFLLIQLPAAAWPGESMRMALFGVFF